MPEPRLLTGPTIEFSKNAKQSARMDRGFVVRELVLKLSAKVEVATGGTTTSRSNIAPGGLWEVVKNIQLKLNSNTNIRDISGSQLKMLNWFYYGRGDADSELGMVGLAAGSSATIESTLVIPLWMVDSRQPIDTQLDATLLSNFELIIDWGQASDVGTATGFQFATDPTIQIYSLNTYGIKGPFNTQILSAQTYSSVPVSDRYQVDLNVGNLYRSFLIGTQTDSNVDLENAINNIRLRSGGTDYVNLDATAFREWYNSRMQMRRTQIDSTGEACTDFVSSNRKLGAWYYLDLVTDGLLSETLNTTGFSELKLEFDVASAITSLIIVPQEIVPLRNGAAG